MSPEELKVLSADTAGAFGRSRLAREAQIYCTPLFASVREKDGLELRLAGSGTFVSKAGKSYILTSTKAR